MIARVEHNGKKKDTVIQCAMEACRVLNKHGVLRQSRHDSHQKKKKDWASNDYYDSDEDDYLDRYLNLFLTLLPLLFVLLYFK